MNNVDNDSQYFRELFLNDTPFLDVRAELEFEKGTFPTAFNEPILRDAERHEVGTCYKQQGQDEAIKLGHRLVSGETKAERIESWCQFVRGHENAHVYCWRGGMRSNLSKQWMADAGLEVPLINGGYKALRHVLLDEIQMAAKAPMIIVGGKTGSAKTPLINSLNNGIDLEGFAHHRGSSFGRRVQEPPAQATFENRLAIDLLKKRQRAPQQHRFFEDESRMIGPVSLPHNLWLAMAQAPIVVVDVSLEFRVQHILQEYVVDMLAEHLAADPQQGFENYRQYLLASLYRIRKRLGSARHQQLTSLMNEAIDRQQQSGEVQAHEAWIHRLLVDYYDPMYEYQLAKKQSRVVYSGDYSQVLAWCAER